MACRVVFGIIRYFIFDQIHLHVWIFPKLLCVIAGEFTDSFQNSASCPVLIFARGLGSVCPVPQICIVDMA